MFDIEQLQENGSTNIKGLRSLYTDNGSHIVSINSITPLIYKNKAILRTLHVNILPISEAELQNLYIRYSDFSLITHMIFWSLAGVQQFIFRSIRNTTTLTQLHVVNTDNIDTLIDTLVVMPALSKFQISHVRNGIGRPILPRFFKRYAIDAGKTSLIIETCLFPLL